MLAKLFHKSPQNSSQPQDNVRQESLTPKVLEPRIAVHYGIPSTASVMAYDPFQHLLAVGTLDGRIKVIGGDNIEGLLISPKLLPFKRLEFLQNQGFLVSISNANEIQVWDLENRRLSSNLQWESNITAFSVVYGTHYMYVGDEYGYVSVMKYDAEEGNIVQLPYHIPANVIAEAAEIALGEYQSVVGLLPQPYSFNRVLIAYDNGVIVLWDVREDKASLVRGSKDLNLKNKCLATSSNDVSQEHLDDSSDCEPAEKEISSLCWASSDGSVLAVGYVDGDILLWNSSVTDSGKDQTAKRSSNDVVKLQLSSGDRRLPVIVLHWSPGNTQKGCGGQLFVYGGDQIGSEEVLTMLNLDWSSGIAKLKCIDRTDLPLNGSFADMIVIPNTYEADRNGTSLFVLTNPGQLHFYDPACLSLFKTEPAKKHSVQAFQYPAIIPTVEPYMTVGKLFPLGEKGNSLRDFLKTVSASKSQASQNMNKGSSQWPLTGGVPSELSLDEHREIERIYVAGYQDGSVRIWDASSPVLSIPTVLGVEVESTEIAGATASITAFNFSSSNLHLAVGNERGLVFLYTLPESSDTTRLYVVTETKHEVNILQSARESHCAAIFSLLTSPVCSLQYSSSGHKLAIGFGCGRVAMLDISSLSVLFVTECVSGSAVISLAMKTFPYAHDCSLDPSEKETSTESAEITFVLTKDAHLVLMDCTGKIICSELMHGNGESTAISLYLIEGNSSATEGSKKHLPVSSKDSEATDQPDNVNHQGESDPVELKSPMKPINLGQRFLESLILLCCEDALYLFPLKSIIQGESNSIHKVDLGNPCSWTTTFKKDAKDCGVIIAYQSGVIEVRSFPDLDVVGQETLMSILRWSFKTNMDKTMSSSDKGLITLVNGSEFAFVSLIAYENDLRIPQALPCLHDKVLAAATDSAVNFFKNQKKDQNSSSGAFAGIIKGLKGVKAEAPDVDYTETRENLIRNLESMFSRFPFSDISTTIEDDLEGVELHIDEIEIDEPLVVTSSTSNEDRIAPVKETEREKLFEGGSKDTKPKMRTREEVIAKYRNTGDAASAAAQAKDKLIERQEKLEKLQRNTEELQSGAENFADLAKELAKKMEQRKWWQL